MKKGYLPEAVINFIALLGWAPSGEYNEQEIFTLDELKKAFEISGISKAPAISTTRNSVPLTVLTCTKWIRQISKRQQSRISARQ